MSRIAKTITSLVLIFPCLLPGLQEEKKISYRDIIQKVKQLNSALLMSKLEAKEKAALLRQAGTWTNPEIEIELENFGGYLEGVEEEAPELTVMATQHLQLSGKRNKEKQIARFNLELAKLGADDLRLNIMKIAGKCYLTLLVAQESEQQAIDDLHRTREMFDIVKAQVESGKVSPLKLKKTQLLKTDAVIAVNKAKYRRRNAYLRLTLLWQDTQPMDKAIPMAAGSLLNRFSLPTRQALWQQVKTSPYARRVNINSQLDKAVLGRQRAEMFPDFELSGGLRKYRHIKGHKWLVALGFQLPLFDWNRGNINAARYRLEKGKLQNQDVLNRLQVSFNTRYNTYSRLSEEITLLETQSLAPQEQLYQATLEGYKAGKFSFLEVLEAGRTLNRTRQKFIEVLFHYHSVILELAHMAGTTLDQLEDASQPFGK